ncbi:hypothetical protein KGQ19_15945 [Catenulispora sp. NL8]|uniref:Tetratricopeptide repeat protein n=1 Tax=Catenulispora pinistramenti TaxID=2705254 RepID=A0ABS5KQN2_9ACTN|nr:hypothetical protein [Catenulispora pinistramenti]MBS2548358.1 hypothetical protein [Catenulispora pinistramenti]
MSTMLTPEQSDAAAAVLERRYAKRDGSHTSDISDRARQVLAALIRRYALAANAARRVSHILLPPLPGDDELDGAPEFATFADAQAYYLANEEGIHQALIEAGLYGVDGHSSRVVRGFEQVMTTVHNPGRRIELAELALTSARCHDDALAEAHALMNRGGGYKMGEQPLKAVTDYQQAIQLFVELHDDAGAREALSRLAVAHAAARHLDDADDTLDQVLALCEEGDVLAALAYATRAWVATQRGEWDQAITAGLIGLDKLQACDAAKVWLADAHLELFKAYIRSGDIENARQHLTAMTTLLANDSQNVPPRIAAALADGELLLAQGHHRDALASYQRAVMLQSANPQPYGLGKAFDGTGQALHGLGEFDRAAEQFTFALRVRLRTGESFAIARSRCYLAKAKAAAGHIAGAVRLREQALTDLTGLVDPAADLLRAELNRLSL